MKTIRINRSISMSIIQDKRPSPIAGLWYSANKEQLSQEIDAYIKKVELPELDGEVIALIAPHAGHRYSGQTAAYAFKCVLGKSYDLVVIVSPFHSFHPSELITTAHAAYVTPLGELPVDHDTLSLLEDKLKEKGQHITKIKKDNEHSLEIELPFLQRALMGEFKLLPIMVHTKSQDIVEALGCALAETIAGKPALLVASTDLSHFYPEEVASRLDAFMLQQMESFSPSGVLEAENSGTGFACGAGALASVLWASKVLGADTVKILHHSTSGEQTGDYSSVVGYGSAVVLRNQ